MSSERKARKLEFKKKNFVISTQNIGIQIFTQISLVGKHKKDNYKRTKKKKKNKIKNKTKKTKKEKQRS